MRSLEEYVCMGLAVGGGFGVASLDRIGKHFPDSNVTRVRLYASKTHALESCPDESSDKIEFQKLDGKLGHKARPEQPYVFLFLSVRGQRGGVTDF